MGLNEKLRESRVKGAEERAASAGLTVKFNIPQEVQLRDRQLITRLQQLDAVRPLPGITHFGLQTRHPEIAGLMHQSYTQSTLGELRQRLDSAGTFTLHINKEKKIEIDGKEHPVALVKATPAEVNGDMDGMVYIRDQNEVLRTYLKSIQHGIMTDPQELRTARELLDSTTLLMSTPGQRNRYERIIREPRFANNYLYWPMVSVKTSPAHLNGEELTNWRHTQETGVKLAHSVLVALDLDVNGDKFLPSEKLDNRAQQFLALQMPFLAAVNFTMRPSSGPWEEQMAIRTSVMGVETALLNAIRERAGTKGFEFLEQGFTDAKDHLLGKQNTSLSDLPLTKETSFDKGLEHMVRKGLETIGQRLPHEATAEQDKGTIRERHADIALLDLLDFGIPALLADNNIPIKALGNQPGTRIEIEDLILQEVFKLFDQDTNGFFRYGVHPDPIDSYLRGDFVTDGRQLQINSLKKALNIAAGGGPINLDLKSEIRAQLTEGSAATWVHPVFQLTSWATEMLLQERNSAKKESRPLDMTIITRYRTLAEAFLNVGVAALTGPMEHQSRLNGDGYHHIETVGELQATECWITLQGADGNYFSVASPHSPLEEGVALVDRSFKLLDKALYRLAT